MTWKSLESVSLLEEIDAFSQTQPVAIFKHSTRCSISTTALSRLERNWNSNQAGSVIPYFLDLLGNREISNAIESRYGVQHESPQLLLIYQGRCIYHTSHLDITFEQLMAEAARIETQPI
jgi:bacillithiol system protein YtxJ